MSTFTQGKQPNSGYGKPTGSYPRPGDRYGNQPKNRRENAFKYEDISSGPPPWLNSYLENFKKKFITELTDNIVRTIDSSYRTSAELRKQRSNYFALKQRLAQLEAERNDDKSQAENIQQQSAVHNKNNDDKKLEEKKFHSRSETNCKDENKCINESIPSSSKISSPKIMDEASEEIIKQSSTPEFIQNLVNDTIEVTRDVIPSEVLNHFQDNQSNTVTTIVIDAQDDMGLSTIQTNEIVEDSNQLIQTEIKGSLEEILNLLCETKFNEEILITDEPNKVDDNIEIDQISTAKNLENDVMETAKLDKTLDEQNQITIIKLTSENLDSVIENIKKIDINTTEKQQEVVDFIFDRAINEPNNSFVYARLCKQFADTHECTATFREMLITRCNIELMNHKEKVTILMKIKERVKCDEEKNVHENEIKSHEFMGTVLFIGELYNQKLLSDELLENNWQPLIRDDSSEITKLEDATNE
ncbi:hypothetical protein PV326_008504 [Microctonus aethiopoides]|nr:hypothetical protein PV326_008504 [Microctonus aethiopoides]